uniref:Uncharacterized protein n=1 Tax=Rhodosorus marinus TaxID=101924 RepID=A0A7S0BNK6_9RHOD|mmetsp:Transcript_24485/g.35337  ORF Transcript_24485/g.35337 Transcript_24485/m.35337 type:complete len:148 (+) Transcript_24485:657-1100(+)
MPFEFDIVYTKGKDKIADALSRHAIQELSLSSVTSDFDWQQAFLQDPEFEDVYRADKKFAAQGFRRRHNLLYRNQCLCVPKGMQDNLLESYRGEPTGDQNPELEEKTILLVYSEIGYGGAPKVLRNLSKTKTIVKIRRRQVTTLTGT